MRDYHRPLLRLPPFFLSLQISPSPPGQTSWKETSSILRSALRPEAAGTPPMTRFSSSPRTKPRPKRSHRRCAVYMTDGVLWRCRARTILVFALFTLPSLSNSGQGHWPIRKTLREINLRQFLSWCPHKLAIGHAPRMKGCAPPFLLLVKPPQMTECVLSKYAAGSSYDLLPKRETRRGYVSLRVRLGETTRLRDAVILQLRTRRSTRRFHSKSTNFGPTDS